MKYVTKLINPVFQIIDSEIIHLNWGVKLVLDFREVKDTENELQDDTFPVSVCNRNSFDLFLK